jgi:hypothetical protein
MARKNDEALKSLKKSKFLLVNLFSEFLIGEFIELIEFTTTLHAGHLISDFSCKLCYSIVLC